jgi:subtilisin family serine protease
VDDNNDYDFANDDDSVYDRHPISGRGDEHGTHVAGTIAAGANDGTGVNAVGWRTRIILLKFLGADGRYTSDAIEAINYATNEDFGVK